MSFHLIPLRLEEVTEGTLRGSQTLATLLLVVLSTIRMVVMSLCPLENISRTAEGVISLATTRPSGNGTNGVPYSLLH